MSAKEKTLENLLDQETISILEDKMIKNNFSSSNSTVQDIKDKVIHSVKKEITEKTITENPYKALGITLLTGLVIGWLIKR